MADRRKRRHSSMTGLLGGTTAFPVASTAWGRLCQCHWTGRQETIENACSPNQVYFSHMDGKRLNREVCTLVLKAGRGFIPVVGLNQTPGGYFLNYHFAQAAPVLRTACAHQSTRGPDRRSLLP